jgi:L-threonylcarbamoyladenylate synthase
MELSPTRADHVFRSLNGRIDLVLDGGACPGGLESTVVDVTGPVVRLLRPGLITIPMLQSVVGAVVTANREPPPPDTVARSPGQMAKHYSPRTPLVIAERFEFEGVQAELRRGGKRLICWELPSDPTEAAARLYDTLHDFDRQDADVIAIALPPDTPEWAAVRDRLLRAAATE